MLSEAVGIIPRSWSEERSDRYLAMHLNDWMMYGQKHQSPVGRCPLTVKGNWHSAVPLKFQDDGFSSVHPIRVGPDERAEVGTCL